jgi:NTP pyrophosphatase (non-canonical NTP hydrolase)
MNDQNMSETTAAALQRIARENVEMQPHTIEDMTQVVRNFVIDRGWYKESRTRSVGDSMMLIVTETSEVLEAWRDYHDKENHYQEVAYRKGDHGEDVEMPKPWKPEGVPSELADILVRLLDTADAWGIDLFAAFQEKMAYNMTRPYQHGGRTI